MRVDLSDDLCDRYLAMSSTIPLATLLERQLARFANFPPTVRIIPLTGDALQQIEHLLGGGSITSGTMLEDRIRGYASVKLGEVVLDLSQAQKQELVHRAEKRGMTPKAVVAEMVGILLDQLFESVTPYR